jgi:hypothetical protein
MSAATAVSTVVSFLVPKTLTWDKLCALWCAIYVKFGPEVSSDDYRICFEDEDGVPKDAIDVDVRSPYNRIEDLGSATERVARDAGLTNENLPGIELLVHLLEVNNRTGCLKDGNRSIVDLIRGLYEVPRNLPPREYRIWVVTLLMQCVETYFDACAKALNQVEAMENPFSMTSFERMLELAGVSDEELIDVLDDQFKKVKRHRQAVFEKAGKIRPNRIFFVGVVESGKTMACHLIVTDDVEVARAYWKQNRRVGVLVIRNRKGNVTIQCNGPQSFEKLQGALVAREPNLWFLDQRPSSPQIHNGSASRAVAPTRIRESELLDLIQQNYKHWLPESQR